MSLKDNFIPGGLDDPPLPGAPAIWIGAFDWSGNFACSWAGSKLGAAGEAVVWLAPVVVAAAIPGGSEPAKLGVLGIPGGFGVVVVPT